MRRVPLAWTLLAVSAALPACTLEDDLEADLASEREQIRGGTTVPVGSLEAVGQVSTTFQVSPSSSTTKSCTGTLITKNTVLTAHHCVCLDDAGTTCATRSQFTFLNVLAVGATVRANRVVGADVARHPAYGDGGWLTNDYAVLLLDEDADLIVQVTPIRVESPNDPLEVGETATLVGLGPNSSAGTTNNCNGTGGKRQGNSTLDSYLAYPDPTAGTTMVFDDPLIGVCPGDSGGPALDPLSRIVGVASTGNSSSNSNYDPTYVAYEWLEEVACNFAFDRTQPDPHFCDGLCPCAAAEGDCDKQTDCQLGTQCTFDVGAAAGLPADQDLCWATGQLVTVYREPSFSGIAQAFPVGTWTSTDLTMVGNDKISALRIKAGLAARLCSEAGGWGTCQDFTGDTTLTGNSLNENTSWIQVSPAVTLFDYTSYGGARQTFKAGNYGASALIAVPNDHASSLIAAPGINVRLCSEGAFWGDCRELWGQVPAIGSPLEGRVSSVEVRLGVTLYGGNEYTGTAQAFPAGTFNSDRLTVIGDNQARSLVVAPGMRARLCSHAGGYGTCREFTGWNSHLGILDGETSWLQVSAL